MNIKEVAKLFGIKANKLRFYEKKGLLNPKRTDNGYRVYEEEDLVRLQGILTYRTLELSIEDIKVLLDTETDPSKQLFKQIGLINDAIHKYRMIGQALESVMDTYLKSQEGKINEDLIKVGQKIGYQLEAKSNWQDRWQFNNWAKTYDDSIREPSGGLKFYDNYDKVLDRVHDLAYTNDFEGLVLDIGVGTGNLASRFPHDQVIGLDQSIEMLYVCKDKYPDISLRYGEFLKLPFEKDSFDRIVSTYVFHHLNDEEKLLALHEMKRVLREGGEIILGDLMFIDHPSKTDFIQTCDERTLREVHDEYFAVVSDLLETIKELNMNIDVKHVDGLILVLRIY